MYKLLIEGFNTKAEVEAFISWYAGEGEQDSSIWFECRQDEGEIEIDHMHTDCSKTYPIKFDEDTAKMYLNNKEVLNRIKK